jgi:hypothetical protein
MNPSNSAPQLSINASAELGVMLRHSAALQRETRAVN